MDVAALGIDAHEVYPRIWVGSRPDRRNQLVPFDRVVLCATEYQPDDAVWRRKVILAGFDDTESFSQSLHRTAVQGATLAMIKHQRGERILVTCLAGINRSAFVAGLMMLRLEPTWTADQVIAQIRARRPVPGPAADFHEHILYNRLFVALLGVEADKHR